jgi:hypothetical protein
METTTQPEAVIDSGTTTSLVLVDNQNRGVLIEGRNYGIGYAFCKKKGNELHTIQPISPCKDYLNDWVYTEKTGKPYGKWGLWCPAKADLFDDGTVWLAYKVCGKGARSPMPYAQMPRDLKAIDANWRNVQMMLNFFEGKLAGVLKPTVIHKLADNLYVAEADTFWIKWTYLISIYSLLIRNAIYWDGNGSPMDFLEKVDGYDADMLVGQDKALERFQRILDGELPDDDWSKPCSWHDEGIMDFHFPAKTKKKSKLVTA